MRRKRRVQFGASFDWGKEILSIDNIIKKCQGIQNKHEETKLDYKTTSKLTLVNAMSSKYELISGDRPTPDGKLLDGVEDLCTLSSGEGRGVTDGGPRVEPAIASFSSSFRDSKLCEASKCGMPNKSWNTSDEKRLMFTQLLFTVNLL